MTEYYKALRPDGTDFATGTTKPRKGRWMPRIDGELIMCERGYHVSDAPGETLIGGRWPCKLARVEIPDGEWERQDHKVLVPTYRVVEWLPAWQALGPNGEAVVALIGRARRMTTEERKALAQVRTATAWTTACGAAWGAAMGAAWGAARDAACGAACGAARDAACGAAMALVVRDLISREHFNILYGPWASVMENTTSNPS